ncbi:MAG: hypothetical protein F6K16_32230 [Symploca sp. SIO2B6]|nr:hypothetical protein [Symploca sp. SIO2B6]
MMAQYAQRPMPTLVVQDDTKVVGVIEQASVLEMMQRRRQEDTAEQTTESIEVT